MLSEIEFNENKKICKNMRESAVNFDSNYLWHKNLKQNRLFATGFF